MPLETPRTGELEPVTITPYSITSGSQIIDPYAIDVVIIVPAGTVATIQTAAAVSFTSAQSISLNSNNRPMSNTFTISRASGSGTITVLVSRVTGRETANA